MPGKQGKGSLRQTFIGERSGGMMTSRERAVLALAHKGTDRVPMDFGGTGVSSASVAMTERIRECLGLNAPRDPRFPHFDDVVQTYLGVDFRPIPIHPMDIRPENFGQLPRQVSGPTDEWGVSSYADGRNNPLRDVRREDLRKFPWPDPEAPERVAGLREYAKDLYDNTDYALVGQHYMHGLFEGGCRLRGYDQFLLDFSLDPDWVRSFFDIMLDLHLKFINAYLGEIGDYIQVMWVGDDCCTQRGPYVSPGMYREFVKPYFTEIASAIKKKTKARLMNHCCGSCHALADDFIDIGIDILNPVQPEADGMDPARLKSEYGDALSFWGGIGLQHLLIHGTPPDVEARVKQTVKILGKGGGYVLAAAHSLPDDVPPENVIALFAAGQM